MHIRDFRWDSLLTPLRPLTRLLGLYCSVYNTAPALPAAEPSADYVVLIHGLGRTAWSMKRLEWALANQGYRVLNVSYPSTRCSIDSAANWLAELLEERAPDKTATVHFVTHSLGGIVLRQFLHERTLENLGRVVMLAPPNQGSEVADKLRDHACFKFLVGPAGQQLGTGSESVPKRLGPATFDLGIIAGDRSANPIFSAWLPGADDGKVSVQSTRVDGMRDFLIVHCTHTWLMWSKQVTSAVERFLAHGHFKPQESLEHCGAKS